MQKRFRIPQKFVRGEITAEIVVSDNLADQGGRVEGEKGEIGRVRVEDL